MAVKVNQYQQRTSVGGLGVVPRASGVQIDNSMAEAGMRFASAAQGAIDTYAQVQERIKAEKKRQEEEDAKVYSANAIAQGAMATMEEFANRQENAEPGAAGFTEGMNDWLDEYEETVVSQAPNDTSRKFLRERFLALRVDTVGRATSFEVDERRKWRVNTGKEAIEATARTVAADPSRIGTVLAEQRALIDAYDVPPEQRRAMHAHLNEQVGTAAVLGEVERDPLGARRKLAARLGVDEVAIAGPGAASADVVWKRMTHQESRDRQFDAKGNPLTSPKGAVGIAQVMPDTGPEAARYANLPWDPERFRTDANYNAALGRAYYDEQLRQFGSPTLAAAAYNAGPGAVGDWIKRFGDPRKGEITLAEFARKIPYKETREYVASVAPPTMSVPQATTANPKGERVGDPAYDLLTVPQVVALLGRTNSELDKQKAQFRSFVAAREADDLAAYGDGKQPPQPLSVAEFVGAYGDVEGMRRFETYQSAQRFASDMSGFSTKTPEEIIATVRAREPVPGEGYAAASQHYGTMVQAANAVLKARADDPIAFAIDSELAEGEPLNLQDPEAMGAGLKARVGVAETMASKYGTRYTLLTKGEAEQMTARMGVMTAPEKAQFLQSVRASLPDPRAYQSVMAQIRPGSPVTATAGSMMAIGGQVKLGDDGMFSKGASMPADQVARLVLAGEDLLNPPKGDKAASGKGTFPMPSDGDMRTAWADYVGTAYAGSPDTEAASYQAFRAFYAAERAAGGDYSGKYDRAAAERAARAVTGGVVDVNDSRVVLPWGLPETYVIDQLRAGWGKARASVGLESVSFEQVGLQTIGDGAYAVTAGTGPIKGPDGLPLVLRIPRSAGGLIPEAPRQ